jgi:hypothetical protein
MEIGDVRGGVAPPRFEQIYFVPEQKAAVDLRTTAGLMSRVDYAPVYFTPSSCRRALFRWRMFFGRPCYEVHGACDVRINLYPAAPFRLAKVLFAWTIVQAGWDSSF